MSTKRARVWATIIYPESSESENWREILTEAAIPAFVSPIHNKDRNPDGTKKKDHYHCMVMLDGVKTKEQMIEFFQKIHGVGAIPIMCTRSYARYLTHMDEDASKKPHYPVEEVEAYGGANYASIITMASDKYTAISEMIDYCDEQSIFCYADLLTYAKDNREDWFRCLCDNGTVTLVQYLKSKHWKYTNAYKR